MWRGILGGSVILFLVQSVKSLFGNKLVQPVGFKFQREGWDPGVKKGGQQMLFSAFRSQEDWGSWRDQTDAATVDEETTTTLESIESLNKEVFVKGGIQL